MTAAAQKELVKQALALPKKARVRLAHRLLESLEPSKEKISRREVLADPPAIYGASKARKRSTAHPADEIISRKEWNQAWMKELKLRAEEMESGADPGVPLDDVIKFLDEKPRRRP